MFVLIHAMSGALVIVPLFIGCSRRRLKHQPSIYTTNAHGQTESRPLGSANNGLTPRSWRAHRDTSERSTRLASLRSDKQNCSNKQKRSEKENRPQRRSQPPTSTSYQSSTRLHYSLSTCDDTIAAEIRQASKRRNKDEDKAPTNGHAAISVTTPTTDDQRSGGPKIDSSKFENQKRSTNAPTPTNPTPNVTPEATPQKTSLRKGQNSNSMRTSQRHRSSSRAASSIKSKRGGKRGVKTNAHNETSSSKSRSQKKAHNKMSKKKINMQQQQASSGRQKKSSRNKSPNDLLSPEKVLKSVSINLSDEQQPPSRASVRLDRTQRSISLRANDKDDTNEHIELLRTDSEVTE